MKKFSLLLTLLCTHLIIWACPVCERQQPALLKGITHGAGPEGRFDFIIVFAAIIIVLVTLFFSIKWLIRPGEKSGDHIKRLILNN